MPTPQQGGRGWGVAVDNVVVTGGTGQVEERVIRNQKVKRVENHLWLWVGLFGTIWFFLFFRISTSDLVAAVSHEICRMILTVVV